MFDRFHPVTQFNQGAPLRRTPPPHAEHPRLGEVSVKSVLDFDNSTERSECCGYVTLQPANKPVVNVIETDYTDTPTFQPVSAVLAQDAEAVRFAAFQAATDAWIANPTPANKSAMIDANIKWHKIGGAK